jgi:DNA polymerase-4
MIRSERVWPRIVAHADMDAFYAAVEQLDDPGLRGRPVLVGSPTGRGVVLTASYEARPFGVGSAMAMAKARRLCPQAVIIPPRFDRYQDASRTIMNVFSDFSPDVEALSLDEAFLDMTGSENIFGGPESIGRQIKDAVRQATGGLRASVGLSATKYVAKAASAYQKPDGLTVVPPDDAKAWLAPLPVSWLWGAGPKNQARLHDLGFHTIGDVASASERFLYDRLGKAGLHFHTLAQAEDPRPVSGRRQSKSIGSEHTLDKDVRAKSDIERHLHRSADAIGRRLKKKSYVAFGVGIKLKTKEFQILSRRCRLSEPTDVTARLYSVGLNLLRRLQHAGPFRLVGMVAYDLVAIDHVAQLDLFSPLARQRRLELAIDDLAARFGTDVVSRANDLAGECGAHFAPTLDFLLDDTLD